MSAFEKDNNKKSAIDPLLFNSEWGSSLFVGVSGTGKTTLMLSALKKHLSTKQIRPKKIYCINTRGNEYDELGGKKADIERVSSLPKKSFLIVEDIIDLGKKNEVHMRTTLNVNLHHKEQKLFAATHSNVKTNLWSNIQYFDHIIFPAEKSNHVNFKSIINFFRLGKESTENFSSAFLENCGKKPKAYVIFDVKNIRIYVGASLKEMVDDAKNCYRIIGDLNGEIQQPETENLFENTGAKEGTPNEEFDKLIKGYKYKARASAVYSLLEKCVLKHFKLTPDLLVHIGGDKKKGKIKISIVDYIQYLVDPETGTPPWKYLTFHKFVCEKCHVPKLMIENPSFSRAIN
jgi:hypothetical protein